MGQEYLSWYPQVQCWDVTPCHTMVSGSSRLVPHSDFNFCKKDGDKLFSRSCCDRTRDVGFKRKKGCFRLVIKKFYTMRMVKQKHRLPEI